MSSRKRALTGSRATGMPHLGNFYGAFQPALELQHNYELFLFVADLHSLNENLPAAQLRDNSLILAASYLACGFNRERGFLYLQSSIPEVTELAWVLACQAPYGLLTRAHSFKDAQGKGVDLNAGVFNYPVLMAADILIFDADCVPVGKDQKQHLEITRDLAVRFNNAYGNILKPPEPIISETLGIVPGIDGEKMSKSKGNHIPCFATDGEWKKLVASIPTDSKGLADPKDPETCRVYALYSLMATTDEARVMADKYRAGGYGYGHAKAELLAKLQEVFGPMRATFQDLINRPDDLRDILQTGSPKVQELARKQLERVRGAVGIPSLLR